MKKKIYFWANDFSDYSGEGKLAKMYIFYLKKVYYSYNFINLNIVNTKHSNFCINFFKKYIIQFYGIFFIWIKFFQNYKVCYINYLPLWNFLVFLLLPPKTLIGPITGSIAIERNFFLKNFCEKISKYIIYLRYPNAVFANNFYKKNFKNYKNNFIIKNFKFKKKKKIKKKFDFIFYYRKNYDKNNFLRNLIIELNKLKFKIVIVGDFLKMHHIKNYGTVNEKTLDKIIWQTKYSISNKENLFSFFCQKCLEKNLVVFYNKEFSKFQTFKIYNFYPIFFNDLNRTLKIIQNKIKIPLKFNTNLRIK